MNLLTFRRLLLVATAAGLSVSSADAQLVRSALIGENNTYFTANGANAIRGPVVNSFNTDLLNSIGVLADTNVWTGPNVFSGSTSYTVNPTLSGCVGYPISTGSAPITCASSIPTSALSGTLPPSTFPALTGAVTTNAGSFVTTLSAGVAAANVNATPSALAPSLGLSVPKGLTFAGTAYSNGDPIPAFQGVSVHHTFVTGADSADPFLVGYNSIFVDQDNAAFTQGPNSAGVAELIYNNFGGSAMKGNRAGLYVNSAQTSTSGNTIQGDGDQYTAAAMFITGTVNDNGSAATYAGSLGAFTGANIGCQLLNGATNIFGCQTAEFNIAVATGASVYKKTALEIVKLANDAVQGTVDGAIIMDDYPGAPGWKYGISFGSNQTGTQFPLTTASTMIGCAGNCGTAGYGVDLLNVSVTNYAFRSLGFSVSGVGQLAVNTGALSNSSSMVFIGGNDGGTEGGQIELANTYVGATTPNKFLRVSNSGRFQILNSAYSQSLFDMADNGNITAITINPGSSLSSGGSAFTVGTNDGGNQGGQIAMVNTNGSATTPNKFIRVAQAGDFQIMNSAYSTAIFDVSDSGAVTTPGLPTSAGSGGLYICVDTTGKQYKKSSCP